MPSLPDFRAFEIAATVIEEGSMTAAASRLRMTQSAVSQAVKRAEAQVAADLLHRDHRPLVPTEAGRLLLQHMRDLARRSERAIEEIRAAAKLPEKQDLRFGMVDTFASAVGPALIRTLMEGAVALRVTAFSGLAAAHSASLMHHQIDAIVSSDPNNELEGIVRVPLFREPFVLVAPAGSAPALAGKPLRQILLERRLIRYSARSHMGSQVEQHLRRLRIDAQQLMSFDTSDSLLAMVAGGVGVAITTPLALLQGAVHLPNLSIMPLPGPGFSRELTLITRWGEFDTLGPRIAELTRDILRRDTLPHIVSHLPWLASLADDMVQSNGEDDQIV